MMATVPPRPALRYIIRARRTPRCGRLSIFAVQTKGRTYLSGPSSNRDLDIDQLLQALQVDVEGTKDEYDHQDMHMQESLVEGMAQYG